MWQQQWSVLLWLLKPGKRKKQRSVPSEEGSTGDAGRSRWNSWFNRRRVTSSCNQYHLLLLLRQSPKSQVTSRAIPHAASGYGLLFIELPDGSSHFWERGRRREDDLWGHQHQRTAHMDGSVSFSMSYASPSKTWGSWQAGNLFASIHVIHGNNQIYQTDLWYSWE
jgi:hypothetical protein